MSGFLLYLIKFGATNKVITKICFMVGLQRRSYELGTQTAYRRKHAYFCSNFVPESDPNIRVDSSVQTGVQDVGRFLI